MSSSKSTCWLAEGLIFSLIVAYARAGNHPGKLRIIRWLLSLPCRKILQHAATGARLDVSGPDYIYLTLILDGTFEPLSVQHAIDRMRTSRGTFLDVGAHMGLYTSTVGLGAGCPVIAIEPSPATHARLVGNVRHNPGLQARVIQAGAASRTCQLALAQRSSDLAAWNTVTERRGAAQPGDIPGRRLDDMLNEWHAGPIGLLKIDVEGFEIDALSGLDWDGPHRPAGVLMECNPQQTDKIQFMLTRGYAVKTVDNRDPAACNNEFPEGNLLFTDQRRALS
jgi:FkbM family methyltransferase